MNDEAKRALFASGYVRGKYPEIWQEAMREMRGPVWEVDGLNCHATHVRELKRGHAGTLRYGWAIGPDGHRYQHTWIQEPDGRICDLFGWSRHEDRGERYWRPEDLARDEERSEE